MRLCVFPLALWAAVKRTVALLTLHCLTFLQHHARLSCNRIMQDRHATCVPPAGRRVHEDHCMLQYLCGGLADAHVRRCGHSALHCSALLYGELGFDGSPL